MTVLNLKHDEVFPPPCSIVIYATRTKEVFGSDFRYPSLRNVLRAILIDWFGFFR